MAEEKLNYRQLTYNANREHYQNIPWFDENTKELKTEWDRKQTRKISKETCKAFPVAEDFVVREILGRGAYGTVILAQPKNEWLEQKLVALKAIKSCHDLKEIFSEAQMLVQIHHDNVINIFSYFYDGTPFLVMEAADGTLEDLNAMNHVHGGCWNEYHLFTILAGIMEGIRMIHEHGILHLDIKPSNVLMVGRTPKLSDFGAAVKIGETHDKDGEPWWIGLPRHHTTFEYANYEGCVKKLDEALGGLVTYASVKSDLYSVGATIFECLQGYKLMQYGTWAYKDPTRKIQRHYAKAHKKGRVIEPYRGRGVEKVGFCRRFRYEFGKRPGLLRNSLLNRVACAPRDWYKVFRSLLGLDQEPYDPEIGEWLGWSVNSAAGFIESVDYRRLRDSVKEYKYNSYTAELPPIESKVRLNHRIKTSLITNSRGQTLSPNERRTLAYNFHYINNRCNDLAKRNKLLPKKERFTGPDNYNVKGIDISPPQVIPPDEYSKRLRWVTCQDEHKNGGGSDDGKQEEVTIWFRRFEKETELALLVQKYFEDEEEEEEDDPLMKHEVAVGDGVNNGGGIIPFGEKKSRPVASVAPRKRKSCEEKVENLSSGDPSSSTLSSTSIKSARLEESTEEKAIIIQISSNNVQPPKRTYRPQESYRRILKVGDRFGCPICSKTYAHKGNCSRHKLGHFKNGIPLHCQCNRKFKLPVYLKEHQCAYKKKGEMGTLYAKLKEEYDDMQREEAEKAKEKAAKVKEAMPKKKLGRPPNPKPSPAPKPKKSNVVSVSGGKVANPPKGRRPQQKAAAKGKGNTKEKKKTSKKQPCHEAEDEDSEEQPGYDSDASVASNPF